MDYTIKFNWVDLHELALHEVLFHDVDVYLPRPVYEVTTTLGELLEVVAPKECLSVLWQDFATAK